MSSTASMRPADFDSLSGLLAGAGGKQQNSDVHARQQAALLAFGRRANAKPPLDVLLQDAVAMLAEILETELMGVAQVVGDGASLSLRVTSIASREQLPSPLIHESSLSDHWSAGDNSMAAYALHLATPVVTWDLATEQRFTDLFLRKLDVHSALSIPLHLTTEPFGALGVYSRKQRVFTLDDLSFAETMAHLLTSSIARMKAEESLHEERAISSTISAVVDTLVMTLDAQGNVVSLNRACQQATGFSIAEIRGKAFCSVFAVPNELAMVEGILRRTVVEKVACNLQSYVSTKHGARRHISWSAQPICGENGSVRSIVLSGTDCTEQPETSAQLHQATAALDQSDHQPRKLSAGVHEEVPAPDARAASCKSTLGETTGAQDERRGRPRQAYRYGQLIAPIHGSLLPMKQEFFEVVCENISAGGILFYLAATPEFKDLVVALGKPPFPMYIAARVAWVMEKMSDGKPVYQVGCRFIGRVPVDAIELPATSPRYRTGQ